jgi:hypothetical protein
VRQALRAGGQTTFSDVDCPACGAYRLATDAVQQIEQLETPLREALKEKAPAVFQAAQARFLLNEAAVFDILRGAYDD